MSGKIFKKVFYGYDRKRVDEMITTKLQEFEEDDEGQRQLSILLNLLKNQLVGAKMRQTMLYKACSYADDFPDYLQRKAQNIAQDIVRDAQEYARKKGEEGAVVAKKIEEVERHLAIVYKEINNILLEVPVETAVVQDHEVKASSMDSNSRMGAKVFSFADFLTSPVDTDINKQKKWNHLSDDTLTLAKKCMEDAGKVTVETVTETSTLQKTVDKLEVLVVEDDESIRRLLVSILEREGFVVHIAADGHEAIQFIDKTTPKQVVLLDCLLPYKSGLQILKHIRSKSAWQQAIVMMMMDHSVEKDIIAAIKNGADDSIQKPFNPREMIAKLHRLIQRQREM